MDMDMVPTGCNCKNVALPSNNFWSHKQLQIDFTIQQHCKSTLAYNYY